MFRPDTGELFGGSWVYLYRWDPDSGEIQHLNMLHRGIIKELAWAPAQEELMSISRQTNSSVLALDLQTGELRENFGQHDLCGASITVTGDGRCLIITSDDASVRIWHLGKEGKAVSR